MQRPAFWLTLLAWISILGATLFVYADGLSGPFLFDDHVHITQNHWVKIETLSPADLQQAWNSSFTRYPGKRPLAQLTFGINHAFAGLDPFAYKATNLGIHLLTGVAVFMLSTLVLRALGDSAAAATRRHWIALLVTAFWLLHPIHVSTVLYTVQRMAQLSTLGLLLAMSCYFMARLQSAPDRGRIAWLVAMPPLAALAFLAKENAVLLPMLLLASEITVLRSVPVTGNPRLIRGAQVLFIALPLLIGAVYLATHPGLMSYDYRPFTLEDRLLTQGRVLWLYLHWLLIPDISAFGLFHDDVVVSTGWLQPLTTVVAWLGIAVLLGSALVLRHRAPLYAFAVCFFFAAHALESTVFPLEMMFEHRNYMASLGPLLWLSYLVVESSRRKRLQRMAGVIGILLLLAYSTVTYVRVGNWSSFQRFVLSGAENHPASARYNFAAAQLLIASLEHAGDSRSHLASTARSYLERGLQSDANCVNCLFGLVVLDLHLGQRPPAETIDAIVQALRSGHVDATTVSVGQFSYLVNWQKRQDSALQPQQIEAIFAAALTNPGWNRTGKASLHAAYREYLEFVVGDLPGALKHAEIAVVTWPGQWAYQMQKLRLLARLGRWGEALQAADRMQSIAINEPQREQLRNIRARIEQRSQP